VYFVSFNIKEYIERKSVWGVANVMIGCVLNCRIFKKKKLDKKLYFASYVFA
jgi:hypothetical protein